MSNLGQFPTTRLRRNRGSKGLRAILCETRLHSDQLIQPLFIRHGNKLKTPIDSMPGQFQFSIDMLEDEITEIVNLGIKAVLLFGIPEQKDPFGSDSYDDKGIIQQAIPVIKKRAPELLVITDACFCEYTDHGHCGVMSNDDIDNDKTIELLTKQAVSHAQAGSDVIAPSGMMDGGVKAIRDALDANDFHNIPILSYAVKYASFMYGPFRDAAEGTPQFGDRKSHQMDIANSDEAIRECALDIQEGADILMVKPAHTYLDIIKKVKDTYPSLPLCAYHVSGEYSMIKAAAAKGWIDEKGAVMEVLTSISRAGADLIITYYAKDVASWLK